jgi:hypothetical protein
MKGRTKNIISGLLALIVLLPIVIQFSDGLFHHHHHHSHSTANTPQFADYHEDCPIASFEYSLFQAGELKYEPGKNLVARKLLVQQTQKSLTNYFDYSFLLRAPPTA